MLAFPLLLLELCFQLLLLSIYINFQVCFKELMFVVVMCMFYLLNIGFGSACSTENLGNNFQNFYLKVTGPNEIYVTHTSTLYVL